MTLEIGGITFDAHNPKALANFWSEATGVPVGSAGDEFARLTPDASIGSFFFIKVPEGKIAKNRCHVDFKVEGDRAAEVERLITLGASEVMTHQHNDFFWTVMQDPEGNEFCVSEKD